MRRDRAFDEVMIVNPFDPRFNQQPNTFMRFHEAPEMGYYAEPPEMGYYGSYAEPPPDMGYYGEAPEMGYYGEPAEYGDYGEPEMGWYGEAPEMGWYGEPPEIGGYADPIEYYAEEMPLAGYGYGYGQVPEMVGYSEPEAYNEYEPLSEEYPGMAYYGEPYMEGYVRERRPTYNPGCPIATNVSGYEESSPLEGYVRPAPVSPSCEFGPPPSVSSTVPPTFAPLW